MHGKLEMPKWPEQPEQVEIRYLKCKYGVLVCTLKIGMHP